MNRHDWVFVGVRLLGVFLLTEGIVTLPMLFLSGPHPDRSDAPIILGPILRIALGASLAVGTNRICSWLGEHGPGQ